MVINTLTEEFIISLDIAAMMRTRLDDDCN